MNYDKFGLSNDGSTYVFGEAQKGIGQIFIEGSRQFARNDFSSGFNRFGSVSNIKNSDYQKSLQSMFGTVQEG